jgi:hypothetical protein
MSTKSSLSSSASKIVEAAVSKSGVALIFDNVPSLGTDLAAADVEKWHKFTKECATNSAAYSDRSRQAARQALVVILMDAQIHSLDYYETLLKTGDIGLPQKKDVLTYALAWHLQINVADTNSKKATDNSKALNRLANAGHRLKVLARNTLGMTNGKINFAYSAKGVESALKIVDAEGGINAMAAVGAATDQESVKVIPLSPEGWAKRRADKLSASLADGAEVMVALTNTDVTGVLTIKKQLAIPAEAMNLIYPQLKLGDKRVQFLKELFAVGEAVVEQKTDLLVDPDVDDPNDAYAQRRVTARQFVFNPDGTMVISPILRESSVIVTVKPKVDLLQKHVHFQGGILGHLKFDTFGRRRAAANLANDREDAFNYDVLDGTGTEGLARIVLKTPVAKTEEDRLKDVGMLIQRVRSKQGNFPLTLDPSYRPPIDLGETPDLLDKMEAVSRSGKALKANLLPVTTYIAADHMAFSGAHRAENVAHGADLDGKKGRFDLDVDDFMAVTAALGKVEVNGAFSVLVDREMFVISFDTDHASYAVSIPTLTEGKRSTKYIHKLAPVAWPDQIDAAPTDEGMDA